MTVVAHDPYIAAHVAQDLGVALLNLDDLCARADYVSLHLPSTSATRHLFDAARLSRCKTGVRIVNTSRGDLIDERALADAIESGHVAGAGLDVFEVEPPTDKRLTQLPQVVATPHIAASTHEAQELVGLETVTSVRDFLRDGIVRNAVNFPSVSAEEFRRLQPALRLAEALGSLASQLEEARTHAVGVRYYGALTDVPGDLLTSAVLVGLFKRMLASGISLVNARAVAAGRGVEVVESRSTRARNFTSLISVKLHTSGGERWVEGAIFEPGAPRLVLLDGVAVEAPLEGTLIVLANDDWPGRHRRGRHDPRTSGDQHRHVRARSGAGGCGRRRERGRSRRRYRRPRCRRSPPRVGGQERGRRQDLGMRRGVREPPYRIASLVIAPVAISSSSTASAPIVFTRWRALNVSPSATRKISV